MQSIKSQTNLVQELTLDAPVSVVTLLEDRAQVRRIGKAQLNQGLWRLKILQVAPVLSDKSLRAEFSQNYPNARIDDVRVRREMLVKEEQKPAEIKALEAEIRSLTKNFSNVTEDRQHLESCLQKINTILTKGLQELPIDAVWGQIDPKTWREQISTLFKQLRDLRAEIWNNYYTQEDLQEKINALVAKAEALARPDMFYTANIEADLMIPETGEYEIIFDYVVPNAIWRPWHQARLLLVDETPPLSGEGSLPEQEQSESDRNSPPSLAGRGAGGVGLSFRMDGCVWQRTGEDWNNVDLVFSTARASLGTEPPLLTDEQLTVKEKSKEIKIELREQKIQTTGLGTDATPSSAEFPATVTLPGVDDGGEVRNLRPTRKATIPSDGRPYRVPIFSFETKANTEYILIPEMSSQVGVWSKPVGRRGAGEPPLIFS